MGFVETNKYLIVSAGFQLLMAGLAQAGTREMDDRMVTPISRG